MSKELTALSRYNANMEGEVEPDPIERLRFFLSLALTGQDWLDVERFIDGVSNQLASRDAEVAKLKDDNEYLYVAAIERDQLREQVKMLRDALSLAYTNEGGYHEWKETASSALAATDDLENVRLCEKEPGCWIHRRGNYADASLCPLCDGDISRGWEQDQLYRAWEPK